MKRFLDLKLGRKLSAVVLASNAATLLLLSLALLALQLFETRRSLANELLSVAQTIAGNTTAALSFGDTRTGQENVEALRADPRILNAEIYTASGKLFASYRAAGKGKQFNWPMRIASGATFEDGSAVLVREIDLNGTKLGRIVLRADLSQLRERVWRYALISLVVLAASLGIGFMLSRSLVRIVTRPISALAAAARKLSAVGNYEIRLEKTASDEVGELTECFNTMLASISQRDRQLQGHREHLEEQVRVRTRELEIACRKAEEVARLKSEFLANMSHEIRTPMNGVLGLTSLTLETDLPPLAREYLELANASAETLLGVINDILDFSKIDAGKMTLESVPFEFSSRITKVLKTLAFQAHKKNLDLICDIDPAIPPILSGDPTRFMQVMVNLVGNAIKFTKTGRISVSVHLTKIEDEWATIRCAVSDTGIGIARDAQKSIFESFTQADGSTTRKYGGTGLGLAISNRLVQLMGGEILVASEPGRGSTFQFEVRLALSREARPAPPEAFGLRGLSALSVATGPETGRSLRILAAEDDPVNQKVLRLMLAKLGHEVTIVDNGRDAVEAALKDSYDLILMDCQMPEVDGFEATRGIRQAELGRPRRTPIIALTAHAMAGDRERCRQAGMDDYLSKPIDRQQLLARLSAVAARVG